MQASLNPQNWELVTHDHVGGTHSCAYEGSTLNSRNNTVLNFVKGHCGWDVVTLLPAGQISSDRELAASLQILSLPIDGGLEVGWMSAGTRPGDIVLRMVNSTTRDWIPMCGGMTQVIGLALVETFLRDYFQIDTSLSEVNVNLVTPAGQIPVTISMEDRRAGTITTNMGAYVEHVAQLGVEELSVEGITVLRVGKYAVIDVRELERQHRDCDFTRRDAGPHLDIVNGVLREFGRRLGFKGVNGMLYDDRPEGPGEYRVFPRFLSKDLSAAKIPWEFQCGTGGIAVAMALVHRGCVHFTGEGEIVLEWGSLRVTPDPFGIRTSLLTLQVAERRLLGARFRHSTIEIIAEGILRLPGFAG